MTDRATFGDFAVAAADHLDSLPRPALPRSGTASPGGDAREITEAVRAALRPMAGYVADVSKVFDSIPVKQRTEQARWIRAARRARHALANAEVFLRLDTSPADLRPTRPGGPAAALHAAAASMTLGRDLLHTHIARGPDDSTRYLSEWAPVLESVPLARATLREVAGWAAQIAPHGGQAAVNSMSGSWERRRDLNAACQWLWVLAWTVDAACEKQPVPSGDVRVLHAIPVNSLLPRHRPAGGEPAGALYRGVIGSADRARFLAARGQAPWAPAQTTESLRHLTDHSAVTAWNCHRIFQALASGAECPEHLKAPLRAAADAAGNACGAWLRAAQAWDAFTTDARGGLSRTAVSAEDLALWTGRLAHADPDWTPVLGQFAAPGPLPGLAATPADLRRAVAAAHHACDAISRLAASAGQQLETSAAAGRLIAPARNLPGHFDVRYALTQARSGAASPLITAYKDAEAGSARSAAAAAEIAETVRAPSRVLAAARTSREDRQSARESRPAHAAARLARWPPPLGPAERVLLDLGITDNDQLERAAELDQATSKLILEAAATAGPERGYPDQPLSRSAGTAELIDHAITSSRDQVPASLLPAPGTAGAASAPARPRSRTLIRTELPASPTAPRQARQQLRQTLTGLGLTALAADAELLTSELVANAAEHAGGPIGLVVREHKASDGRSSITCEITDNSPNLPEHMTAGQKDERGRGLQIVAVLASSSGVHVGPHGKTFWFTLTTPDDPSPAARKTDPEMEAEPGA